MDFQDFLIYFVSLYANVMGGAWTQPDAGIVSMARSLLSIITVFHRWFSDSPILAVFYCHWATSHQLGSLANHAACVASKRLC